MKLDLVESKLKEIFTSINIKFEYEMEEGCLVVKASNVKLPEIDDDIIIRIGILTNGACYVEYIFDKLNSIDIKAYELLNKINMESAWIKAYVNNDNYLILNHSVLDAHNEDLVLDVVKFVLNYVGNEKILELLKPICALTTA